MQAFGTEDTGILTGEPKRVVAQDATLTSQLVSKRGVVAGVAALALTGVLMLSVQSAHLKSDASTRATYTSNQTVYDETQGNRSYYLASATYCEAADVEAWSCLHCVDGVVNATVIEDEQYDLYFLAGYDAKYDQVFFTIRGSSVQNWLQYNLNFIMEPYESDDADAQGAMVHTGFQEAYHELKEEYWQTVKNYISYYPNSPILVTGHSLGGAQGTLLALDINAYLNDIGSSQKLWVNTFGMPRVGNDKFAEYYNNKIEHSWRVVYQIDFVPKVPPDWLAYRHTKNEVYYYCHDPLSYKICETAEDDDCQHGTFPKMSIDDHFIYYNHWYTCNTEGKKEPTASECLDG